MRSSRLERRLLETPRSPLDPFTLARDSGAPGCCSTPARRCSTAIPHSHARRHGHCIAAGQVRTRHSHAAAGASDAGYRVPEDEWSVGYGQTPVVDGVATGWLLGRRRLHGASRGSGRPAHAPRGRLGRTKRLIQPRIVRQVTRDVGTPGNCGIGWWSNNEGELCQVAERCVLGWGRTSDRAGRCPSLSLHRRA